jgi:hypothetical protein
MYMLTICWAAKGGSGTTVFAAAKALTSPTPTLLIDLDGDVTAVLGMAEPDGPGIRDWLRSDSPPERLTKLEHRVTDRLGVIAAGRTGDHDDRRWYELAAHLRQEHREVVVDAGTGRPPAALLAAAGATLLVTRPCYLSLRHAVTDGIVPSGVVVVDEPGRSLRPADIEASLGAPVAVTTLLDPAIARAVDAGLLLSRLPAGLRRQLRRAA